jgi:pimeloyl-ACP methyl ester carboxylesterase
MRAQVHTDFEMHYEDAGGGRPLVLVHAFPLCREMWRPQINAFRDRCRVIAPDSRGFGGSGGFTSTPSVDQMADDVAGLLDALEVREPIALTGLSMGGYVTLAFARRHSARLRALVLADTRAEADDEPARANRDRLIGFMGSHTAADLIQDMMPRLVSPQTRIDRARVVDEIRRMASAQTADGVVGALEALRDRPDATPCLAGIAVPTLVMVGAEDQLTPPPLSEKLATTIPGARLAMIGGAGHLANLERPEAFNDALGSFLGEVD